MNTAQSFRLNKKSKLIKTDEFSSVFSFRKRVFAKYLVIHYQPNALTYPRLGLVVAKKIAKLSVDRNYMRRVLRECFRLQQHELNALDLIVQAQKKFTKQDFLTVKQEFAMLVEKLNRRTNEHTQKPQLNEDNAIA